MSLTHRGRTRSRAGSMEWIAAAANSPLGHKAAEFIGKSAGRFVRSQSGTSYRDYVRSKSKKRTKMMDTPGGKVTFKTGRSSYGRSAGFLGSKKITKKRRKYIKKMLKGSQETVEVGSIASTTSNTLWLGHNSCPSYVVYKNIWREIVRRLALKFDYPIAQYTDLTNLNNGDTFNLVYQTSDGTTSQVTYTIVSGSTWDNVAAAFYGSTVFRAVPGVTFLYMTYTPALAGSNSHKIRLEGVKVHVHSKSSMKMQNRTITTTGNVESDDIDNAPVYGRSYAGNGTGCTYGFGKAVTLQLIADSSNGLIQGTASDIGMSEPISSGYFHGVKGSSKAKIEPGEIKTSVLSYKKTMDLNKLALQLWVDASNPKIRQSFGKYRFFAFERMVDSVSGLSVAVAYEINHRVDVSLSYSPLPTVAPVFTKTYL